MDELGVKMNSPVSSWNLDSGKSNVPGYTIETNSPLLAGTASSILNSSSVSVSVRTWFCGVGHLELVRWIMTSYFRMTSFQFKIMNFKYSFVTCLLKYIFTVSIANCVFAYSTLLSMFVKNDKNVALTFYRAIISNSATCNHPPVNLPMLFKSNLLAI